MRCNGLWPGKCSIRQIIKQHFSESSVSKHGTISEQQEKSMKKYILIIVIVLGGLRLLKRSGILEKSTS